MRGCVASSGGKRVQEAREARAEGEGAFERAGGAPLAAGEVVPLSSGSARAHSGRPETIVEKRKLP